MFCKVFSGVFIIEAILKIIAMNKYYFYNGWNIFDLIIVIASVIDMGVESISGLSVLRTFRLVSLFFLLNTRLHFVCCALKLKESNKYLIDPNCIYA